MQTINSSADIYALSAVWDVVSNLYSRLYSLS